jgi:hypothetical protein
MPSEYQKRVGAARRTALALTGRQQREISAYLEEYADELSRLVRSGKATSSQIALQREVKELLHRLNEDLARNAVHNTRLQARTTAQLQAEAQATVLAQYGLDPDILANRLGGVGSRAAQAVIARDGYAHTFVTLRQDADQAAERILTTPSTKRTRSRPKSRH